MEPALASLVSEALTLERQACSLRDKLAPAAERPVEWLISDGQVPYPQALDAMRADPGMGGDDETWCFSVYDVEVDDPKCREQDMRFYAFDGRECQSPDEAFEALLSARAAARP